MLVQEQLHTLFLARKFANSLALHIRDMPLEPSYLIFAKVNAQGLNRHPSRTSLKDKHLKSFEILLSLSSVVSPACNPRRSTTSCSHMYMKYGEMRGFV